MTAVTYTTYSFGDRDNGWWLEFRSDSNQVHAHKRVAGVYSKAEMTRKDAIAFVLRRREAGAEVRKHERTLVPGSGLRQDRSPATSLVDNGIEAGGAGMLEAKVVDPRRHVHQNWTQEYDQPVETVLVAPTVGFKVPTGVADGFYTVVRDGEHRTYRVRTAKNGNFEGKTIVSLLTGPQNDSDFNYRGFAFLVDGGTRVVVWKKFRGDNRLARDVEVIIGDPKQAGQAFAKESGNCYRCNRLLTVPSSIDAGLGPICAGRE